jgi:hypothetical protein
VVALVPGQAAEPGSRDWLGPCGKTQLAVYCAESLWQSRELYLLIWIAASDRAAVLSGYLQAAVAVLGLDTASDGDASAARLISWLGETSQPWLIVFDDLSPSAPRRTRRRCPATIRRRSSRSARSARGKR